MSSLGPGWYLRRLRGMSPVEVAYRCLDVARRKTWARRQVRPGVPITMPADVVADRSFGPGLPATARDAVPADARTALIAAAEAVLAGEWTVLGHRRADSADPDWFADPVTGRRAPQNDLAFTVKHRDEQVTGNIKQVWEMSRHHHVTVLAAAWWLSEDPRYAEAAATQLQSWWKANPFLSGVHWTSGIEAGVRLISWVWVRRLLADWPKVGDLFEHNPAAVAQIAWHQEFLVGFPSRGSSANNHVIAEAAGRLAAASAFPWYARSPRWRDSAAALLSSKLAANTFDSGVNRELATDYHRFVLELGLVAAAEADAGGHPLPAPTWALLGRMLDAGVALLDTAGHPPRQGDGDEGRGLVVDDPERDPWSVALGAGAAVLGTAPWWPARLGRLSSVGSAGSVQAALLGALGSPRQVPRAPSRPVEFTDAGIALLRSRPEDGPEIWCRADGGPHGFLKIAAHAHADALALEVRHDGVEILVDPGTYCYHGEPEWRSWFRSTAAHNTLQVAGVDQSQSGGPFLWSAQAITTVLGSDLGDLPVQTWAAEHDGYLRLPVPVRHRRTVTLDSPARSLSVRDDVVVETRSGSDPRSVLVALTWHLGPEVTVDLDGAAGTNVAVLRWTAGTTTRTARLRLPGGLAWSVRSGEADPPYGWFSPAFGEIERSTVLVGQGETETGTLVTELIWEPDRA